MRLGIGSVSRADAETPWTAIPSEVVADPQTFPKASQGRDYLEGCACEEGFGDFDWTEVNGASGMVMFIGSGIKDV